MKNYITYEDYINELYNPQKQQRLDKISSNISKLASQTKDNNVKNICSLMYNYIFAYKSSIEIPNDEYGTNDLKRDNLAQLVNTNKETLKNLEIQYRNDKALGKQNDDLYSAISLFTGLLMEFN